MQPVEGSAPPVEDVAPAVDDVVLQGTACGDDRPLEVLLPPQVGRAVGRGADVVVVQPVRGAPGGEHPPVGARVAGVEHEVDVVDVGVVVADPVRLPGGLVAPVEPTLPPLGRHLVDEPLGVALAAVEPTHGPDPRRPEGPGPDGLEDRAQLDAGQLRLDEHGAAGAAGEHVGGLDPAAAEGRGAHGHARGQGQPRTHPRREVGRHGEGLGALGLGVLGRVDLPDIGGRDQPDPAGHPVPAVADLGRHGIDREHELLTREGGCAVVAERRVLDPHVLGLRRRADTLEGGAHGQHLALLDALGPAPDAVHADDLAPVAHGRAEPAPATEHRQRLTGDVAPVGDVEHDVLTERRLGGTRRALLTSLGDDVGVLHAALGQPERAGQLGQQPAALQRLGRDLADRLRAGHADPVGPPEAAEVAGPHPAPAAVDVDRHLRAPHVGARSSGRRRQVATSEDVAADVVDIDVGLTARGGREDGQGCHDRLLR